MINQYELKLYERFFIENVEFVVTNINKDAMKSTITARTIVEKEEDAETFIFIKSQKFPWNIATKTKKYGNDLEIIPTILTTILLTSVVWVIIKAITRS